MQTQTITYRNAVDIELSPICSLLEEGNLPTSDIKEGMQEFIVAEDGKRLVGNIGLETYDDVGLLRSMVVSNDYRNAGIASQLIELLIDRARQKGLKVLYLVTNTAEVYFLKKGFEKITRAEVDKKLLSSTEFNGLCPVSSVIMMKPLILL